MSMRRLMKLIPQIRKQTPKTMTVKRMRLPRNSWKMHNCYRISRSSILRVCQHSGTSLTSRKRCKMKMTLNKHSYLSRFTIRMFPLEVSLIKNKNKLKTKTMMEIISCGLLPLTAPMTSTFFLKKIRWSGLPCRRLI